MPRARPHPGRLPLSSSTSAPLRRPSARRCSTIEGLMVITNNINVANRMRIYPQFEVVIAGGVVRGLGRRRRRRGGGRFHPPVQGRLCGHRCLGHRPGRLAARFRFPGSESRPGDHRQHTARHPRFRFHEVRADRSGPDRPPVPGRYFCDGPLRAGAHPPHVRGERRGIDRDGGWVRRGRFRVPVLSPLGCVGRRPAPARSLDRSEISIDIRFTFTLTEMDFVSFLVLLRCKIKRTGWGWETRSTSSLLAAASMDAASPGTRRGAAIPCVLPR